MNALDDLQTVEIGTFTSQTVRCALAFPERVGPYRVFLNRLLGQGRYGTVFYAEHDKIRNQKLAIKFIPVEGLMEAHREVIAMTRGEAAAAAMPLVQAKKAALAYVLDEANRAAKVKHPNVIMILNTGVSDKQGFGWIAMEFAGEVDLQRCLTDPVGAGVRLTVEDAVQISIQIASGLAAIHDAGFVHRDIKPANILLAKDPANPHRHIPKISDFSALQSLMGASFSVNGTYEAERLDPEALKRLQALDVKAAAEIAYHLIAHQPVPSNEEEWFCEPTWQKVSRVQHLQWVLREALKG